MIPRGRIVLATALLLCFAAGPVFAQEVIAGYDLLKTQSGQTHEDLSNLSAMCPGAQVIGNPIITLRGIPLEDAERPACAAGQNIGETDTFIRRLSNTSGLNSGFPVPVPIEIVALHLQSVQPFTVNNNSQIELWTLDVSIQGPQPSGNMQIQKTHATGGIFSSNLLVQPTFTFTRVSPCPEVVRCIVPAPVIQFQSFSNPWSYSPGPDVLQIPGCTTNFFPGVSSAPGFSAQQVQVAFNETALLAAHGIIPPPPPKLRQTDWQMAVHFDFLLQNNGNQQVDDFHIKNAKYIPMDPVGSYPDSTIYIKSVSICDPTPFWPPVAPVMWCRVDWDSNSPTFRKIGNWHFPPVPPGGFAPAMDIVFSVPCWANPAIGAWYEVTAVCTFNCLPVDSMTFRFHCLPEPPCNRPCLLTPPVITSVPPKDAQSGMQILQQNSPNPFGGETLIQFNLPREGSVALRIYDTQGRMIRQLMNERRNSGPQLVRWDGRGDDGNAVTAGAYFYELEMAGVHEAKRMIVIR